MGNSGRPLAKALLIAVGIPLLLVVVLTLLLGIVTSVANYIALEPVAARLGTERSKGAVIDRITSDLRARQGATKGEVHAYLEWVDPGASFLAPHRVRELTQEDAYLTLADTSWGWRVWHPWSLYYDREDRLTSVSVGEGFP